MEGIGIFVDFDGERLVVQSTNAVGRLALGADRVVLVPDDLLTLAIRDAGTLSNGRLELVTRDGRRYRLDFTRWQREAFAGLHTALAAARGDVVMPRPRVPDVSVTLRGRGYFSQEVVGETHHAGAVEGLAGQTPTGDREFVAEVRREPENRYDPSAVRVSVEGQVVGYLPRDDAAEYGVALDRIGGVGWCRARVWWRRDEAETITSVALDLAEPALLIPLNTVDESARHLMVPPGRPFKLSRLGEHLDVLVPLVRGAYLPGKALVVGSLHVTERVGSRSTSEVVTVRVDGREIGEVSKQTSAKLLPLVDPLTAAGVTCHADVHLIGNALAVEARLFITPPEELPRLRQAGPTGTPARLTTPCGDFFSCRGAPTTVDGFALSGPR
ncbi:HIRAN domain-containing protein [Actinokineospora iranica]|uniref:HIRAN domain-containing protein n=1 Tax=Actinokineospora iranica TaxID=1271860 RepID=A0A1G6JDJ8_9PSEU|nr:HIRAN domain-containing protein [Actinokineospora iranica]SDC16727.1 HIRAN domain-containing protein [Actinokineospora iranica]